MTITDDELKAILAGCEGATPGPWDVSADLVRSIDGEIAIPLFDTREPWKKHRRTSTVVRQAWHNQHHIARLDPDTVKAIVTELLALRQSSPPDGQTADGWQDISTAPKDGTWVEAFRPREGIGTKALTVHVRWHQFGDGDSAWIWPDDTYEVFTEQGRYDAERLIDRGDIYEDTKFTHWRSLPVIPKAPGEEH